jgi:excisionase family DNA binding protein
METSEKLCLNVRDVARLLNLSRNSCYQACLKGEIPCLRIGKRILVPKVGLDRILNEAGKAKDQDG